MRETEQAEERRRHGLEMTRLLVARNWGLLAGLTVAAGILFMLVTAGLPYEYDVDTRVFSRNEEGGMQQVQIGGLQTATHRSARRKILTGRHVVGTAVRRTGGNLLLYPDWRQNPLGNIYFLLAGKLGMKTPVDGGVYFKNVRLHDTSLDNKEIDAKVSGDSVELEIAGMEQNVSVQVGETYDGERLELTLVEILPGVQGDFHGKLLSVDRAIDNLAGKLSYTEYGSAGEVFDFGIVHRNTHFAKQFTREAVDIYRKLREEGFQREMESRVEFADREIERVRNELNSQLDKLSDIGERTDPELLTEQGKSVLKRLTELRVEREKLKLRLGRFRQLQNDFRAEQVGDYLLFLEEGSQRSALQDLSSDYLAKKAQKRQLLEDLTPQHPRIKALDNQMSSIEQSIRENVDNLVDKLERQLGETRELIAEYENRAGQIPELQQRTAKVEQAIEVKKEIYKYLVQKRMEAEVQLEGFRPLFHVIDRPEIPLEPYRPSVKMGGLIGGVSGFFLAIIWLAFHVVVLGRAVSPRQVEHRLDCRTLLIGTANLAQQAERCAGILRAAGRDATVLVLGEPEGPAGEFISRTRGATDLDIQRAGGRGELTGETVGGRSLVCLAGWSETTLQELAEVEEQIDDLGGELEFVGLLDPDGEGERSE